MREQGVITRDVAVVDPREIGRPTFFVVSLEIERERPELLAQLREWLTRCAEVQQAFYVTGETDFVIVVTARDTEAFDAMMSRLVQENPNVRRFTTNVVLNLLKQGLSDSGAVGRTQIASQTLFSCKRAAPIAAGRRGESSTLCA